MLKDEIEKNQLEKEYKKITRVNWPNSLLES
jgi:hypothetical protein